MKRQRKRDAPGGDNDPARFYSPNALLHDQCDGEAADRPAFCDTPLPTKSAIHSPKCFRVEEFDAEMTYKSTSIRLTVS